MEEKKLFSIKTKSKTHVGPTGNCTRNLRVCLGSHLTPGTKFTFELSDLKHIYKLFAVPERGWMMRCQIKSILVSKFRGDNSPCANPGKFFHRYDKLFRYISGSFYFFSQTIRLDVRVRFSICLGEFYRLAITMSDNR